MRARATRVANQEQWRKCHDSDRTVASSGTAGHCCCCGWRRYLQRTADAGAGQGAVRQGPGAVLLSFRPRQDAGDRGVRRHPAARRALGLLPRHVQGRDRQDADRQLSFALERHAGAEYSRVQHRRQAGAVRHRHGHLADVRAHAREDDGQPQGRWHRSQGHRCGGGHARPLRSRLGDHGRRRQAQLPERADLHLAGRFRLLDRRGQARS